MCFKETLPSLNDLEPCNPEAPGPSPQCQGHFQIPGFPAQVSSRSGSEQALRSTPHNLFMVIDGLPNQCIHTAKPGAGQKHPNSLLKFRPISVELRR